MNILESFLSSLLPSDVAVPAVRGYFKWQNQQRVVAFSPSADDDVDLRTYLLELHTNGMGWAAIGSQIAALKLFYQWAHTQGLITNDPFAEYDFTYPILTNVQTDPRQQMMPIDLNEREVERLQALSQIAAQLNSSVNIQSALDNTLKTLLQVMNLQTGWITMLTKPLLDALSSANSRQPGFTLAAAYGLPPGLERDDRRFLRQPPICHCQHLLSEGRLHRAVNIVECARLRNSMQAAGDNRGLRFHASVPLISHGEPLGLINVATAEWQWLSHTDLHFLSAVSAQLVVAIERAHFYEVAEARRILLEKELRVAREVQAGLMPRVMPNIPGYHIAGAWRPALEVAGDFYKVFPLEDGRWGLVIGDVADKGTAAALYMAMIDSLILSGTWRQDSPAAVLAEVNQTILYQWQPTGMFVTVFLAVLDPQKNMLRYANAGHNPPLVRRTGGVLETLTKTGSALGIFEDLELNEETIVLRAGDALMLYTDGVTDAWQPHPHNEAYGNKRLMDTFRSAPDEAGRLLAHLEADLNTFSAGAPQMDDITLLVLTKD